MTKTAKETDGIDYLVLVNRVNAMKEDGSENRETVSFIDGEGKEGHAEKKAYEAFLNLQKNLEEEGIFIKLDNALRTIAEQMEIMDHFIEQYGPDYAAKFVAKPGYSEHHTGLALDLYLNVDGKDQIKNEEMVLFPKIWERIHKKLAGFGFILRYPHEKEHITGYSYEPWHIRYLHDPKIASKIMNENLTLEEYLGAVPKDHLLTDYGTSSIYTEEERKEAAVQVKCRFAAFPGCDLQTLRYAGDECAKEENIQWLNEIDPGKHYTQVMEFLTDFHSPKEGISVFENDREYRDYQWWLARREDGGWNVITSGY